ncbi:hypothetical protein ACFJIY_23145 [Pimelobacter simplex]|uniref:hypothetical protein n=1 Tax=Nocardioides simplex TaxID=2045 RepID=UPI00366E5CCD
MPDKLRSVLTSRRAFATLAGMVVVVAGIPGLVGLPGPAVAASDTTPPVITIEIPPSTGTGVWDGWYPAPRTFVVRATDDGGVHRISYRLTGAQNGEREAASTEIEGRISAEGVTLITMTATDVAGNVATRTYGVGIDLTDPTIDIVDPGLVIEDEETRVTFSCADSGGAIVSCTAENRGQPFASGDPIYTGPGVHAVQVTAVDRVGRTGTASYNYHPQRRRTLTRAPEVTGSPRIGGTLRITNGTVTPPVDDTAIRSRWYVDEAQVAVGNELRLTPGHLGRTVRCEQTFSNFGYLTVTAPCRFAGGATGIKVLPAAWTVLQRPKVTGRFQAGRTLRAVPPRLSAPAAAHRYQWLRNGRPIRSATWATYKLGKADRGRRIAVRIVSTARDQQPLVAVSAAQRVRR